MQERCRNFIPVSKSNWGNKKISPFGENSGYPAGLPDIFCPNIPKPK
jgi:hypothetical protein